MRYSLSGHGSGSKLSSLAEQTELETQKTGDRRKRSGSKRSNKIAANKRSSPVSTDTEGGSHRIDRLITVSQVLGSDEDEEEEVDFPLSLSLQSSQSSNKTDEQESAEVADRGGGWDGDDSQVATPTCKARLSQNQRQIRRCQSAGTDRRQSEQLSENFHQINSRAASLNAHQSLLESSDSMTPTTMNQYDLQVSPAAKIKPMNPTFRLPSPHSSSTAPLSSRPPSRGNYCRESGVIKSSDLGQHSSKQEKRGDQEEGEGEEEEEEEVTMGPLRQAMNLAKELMGMAQARQGPIMLLSTDLSSSGGMSQSQRYSEQLVLYAKAVAVLDSGLRRFQIEMATSSMELDQALRTGEY